MQCANLHSNLISPPTTLRRCYGNGAYSRQAASGSLSTAGVSEGVKSVEKEPMRRLKKRKAHELDDEDVWNDEAALPPSEPAHSSVPVPYVSSSSAFAAQEAFALPCSRPLRR